MTHGSGANAPAKATTADIIRLMKEQPLAIRDALGEPDAQLSIPADGKGLRVLVSVPALPATIPDSVVVMLGNKQIEVPLEINDDPEPFHSLGRSR